MNKILIICQKMPSEYASFVKSEINGSGGWIDGFIDGVKSINEYKFYFMFEGLEENYKQINNIHFIQATRENFEKEINDINPSIIQIFGTEFIGNYQVRIDNRYVVWIQGLLKPYTRQIRINSNSYFNFSNIFKKFIYQLVRYNEIKGFEKRSKEESNLLKKVENVIGRTEWDYSVVRSINDGLHYHNCNELIRDSFYKSKKWNFQQIEKYSIYITQANYCIKGLHTILSSIKLVKDLFPHVKVYISGGNPRKNTSLPARLGVSYTSYLIHEISNLSLESNIIFLGNLDSDQVVERMLKSHVFLLPSLIENSCNSLLEAQTLGVPVVASYVGGTPEYIDDGKNGLMYPCFESELLANKLIKLFKDEEFCKNLSFCEINSTSEDILKLKFKDNIRYIYSDIINRNSEVKKR